MGDEERYFPFKVKAEIKDIAVPNPLQIRELVGQAPYANEECKITSLFLVKGSSIYWITHLHTW